MDFVAGVYISLIYQGLGGGGGGGMTLPVESKRGKN